jgi:predicted phosphodiesterase
LRILLLSDIHANLEALEACLAAAPAHDVVANLGDIVGYGASPNEVVDRSRELGKIFVRGNHEWVHALPQGPRPLAGVSQAQLVHGSQTDEDLYVVSLGDALVQLLADTTPLTFFGHTHLQGGFFANGSSADGFRPEYKTVGQPESIALQLKAEARYLINPGSVGQPRDGDWRAAFALYDTDAQIVHYHRTPYNLKAAQDRIFDAKLPARLATRLAAGR